jgi:hypothetical protein
MRCPAAAGQTQDGVCARRPVWPGLYAAAGTLVASIPQAHGNASRITASNAFHYFPRNTRLESTYEGQDVESGKWVR